MTGPEHYAAAERLIAPYHVNPAAPLGAAGPSEKDIARAQVHATLALAAATTLEPKKRVQFDGGVA